MGRGVLVGQRYGSGSSECLARFYCESVRGTEGGLLLLRQVVNAGEMRPAHFLICHPTFLPPAALVFFFCFVTSLSWRTRWLPSAAAFLSVGENHRKIQRIDFSVDTRKSNFQEAQFL